MLGHVTNGFADALSFGSDIQTGKFGTSGAEGNEAKERPDEGTFARAVGAKQAECLALDCHGQVRERLLAAVVHAEIIKFEKNILFLPLYIDAEPGKRLGELLNFFRKSQAASATWGWGYRDQALKSIGVIALGSPTGAGTVRGQPV